MATLEDVMIEVRRNNRVCPQPRRWTELYDLLPNKRRQGGGWEPALPLILAAWWDTPAMLKMLRLQEHIEWAATHGVLDTVHEFLAGLKEEDWHHLGD